MLRKFGKFSRNLFFSFLIAATALSIFVTFEKRRADQALQEEQARIANENTAGKILGEGEQASQFFASENFRSPQITFGGDAITFPSGQESIAPEIVDMRSELLTTKNEQKIKFILNWKTNKQSLSTVEYMREGQTEGKQIAEDGFGYIHSAEITPLNFSTSYSYIIRVKDKWGNEIQSDKLTFYTGAPNVSILDLLGGAFKDMFGWASKK